MTMLEILVEEPSVAIVITQIASKVIPNVEFEIRQFRGKDDLLKSLPLRLRGYKARMQRGDVKVVVLVDRDDDDCVILKEKLDSIALTAGLAVKSADRVGFRILNRVIIEELESWFFGDVPAICSAYPRVSKNLGQKSRYRDPDAIKGGTWEALHEVLKDLGYHRTGFSKLEVAQNISMHMNVEANRSKSFQVFRDGLRLLMSEGY